MRLFRSAALALSLLLFSSADSRAADLFAHEFECFKAGLGFFGNQTAWREARDRYLEDDDGRGVLFFAGAHGVREGIFAVTRDGIFFGQLPGGLEVDSRAKCARVVVDREAAEASYGEATRLRSQWGLGNYSTLTSQGQLDYGVVRLLSPLHRAVDHEISRRLEKLAGISDAYTDCEKPRARALLLRVPGIKDTKLEYVKTLRRHPYREPGVEGSYHYEIELRSYFGTSQAVVEFEEALYKPTRKAFEEVIGRRHSEIPELVWRSEARYGKQGDSGYTRAKLVEALQGCAESNSRSSVGAFARVAISAIEERAEPCEHSSGRLKQDVR